jgi:flagellar protein FlaI
MPAGKPEVTEGYPYGEYKVKREPLSREEQKVYEAFLDLLFGRISLDHFVKSSGFRGDESLESFITAKDRTLIGKPVPRGDYEQFCNNISPFVDEFGVDTQKVAAAVTEAVHGYKTVQPLFSDEDLEEIIINGIDSPIIVIHRKWGACRTNLSLKSAHELRVLVSQLGADENKPFDDLRLPDGCRANVTFEPAVSQTAITIRKFRYTPMSIIDIISNGTIDSELAGFLWLAVDGFGLYPLNVLIAGGTASGKTTTLNALAGLVPPNERVVSIEDTREINLFGRENWIAQETTEKATLEDLVRNTLRMRPDRVIVGEIRGREAEDLFTAMNVGHRGTIATLHANSDRDAVKRLENTPMDVPRQLLPLVDVIMVQHRLKSAKSGKITRKVVQVSEVSRIEDEISLNEIFAWDPAAEKLVPTKLSSQSREKVAKAAGMTLRQIGEEIERRRKMVDYLLDKGITQYENVCKFMQTYYAESSRGKA